MKSLQDLIESGLVLPAQGLCLELAEQQDDTSEAIRLMHKMYDDVTNSVGSAKSLPCACDKSKTPLGCVNYDVFMNAKHLVVYMEMQKYYSKDTE